MGAGRSERPAAAEYRNSILTEKLHAGAGGVRVVRLFLSLYCKNQQVDAKLELANLVSLR
jgi:hypothetical protein